MSRHTYVNPKDEEVFLSILAKDPECNRCFECGSANAQWCDVMHGTFICLNCSGQHRGLGVHLSFVRSSTMDGWMNWKPEKLRQMELGGNRRARLYFEANNVPKSPIKARYESLGALRYADLLEAEALGKPFNESAWQPPAWYTRLKAQSGLSPSSPAPTSTYPPTMPNRFAGMGSQGQANVGSSNSNSNIGGSDWFSALSSGWNAVSQKTAELAQQATEAVQNADVDGMKSSLAQKWANVSTTVSSYATEIQNTVVSGHGGGANPREDGLAAMIHNARQAQAESGVTVDPARFDHIDGTRASPVAGGPPRGAPAQPGGGNSSAMEHTPVYQGRVMSTYPSSGSAPVTTTESRSPNVVAPTTAMGVGSPNRPPNPLSSNTGTAVASSSSPVAKPQKKDDWAWDDF
ncbi:putative ADP-ribosylation factor GTPase activating protein 1 [Leptomonas seymouri]|uniref:Putative ADP-ribosylation factor GTPase activating protein 1 n=1 Tax=Leptomonas seymouri TaxID=5684 RepID=A0A0N1IMX1_LEPSE|nr:putative ADP-ribosylation factor GTPase activating protein 1 [Leptomonas seymouri]|eukprot:KPI90842.1 putative ADP-ribosylation factor GTPase activating protein 1 [Leptomonas seymouri]